MRFWRWSAALFNVNKVHGGVTPNRDMVGEVSAISCEMGLHILCSLVARQGSNMTWAGAGRGLSNKATSPQRPSCLRCGSAACDARMCGEQCLGHAFFRRRVSSTARACEAGALHSEALRGCSTTCTAAQRLWQGGCYSLCGTGEAGVVAVAARSITRFCLASGAVLHTCAHALAWYMKAAHGRSCQPNMWLLAVRARRQWPVLYAQHRWWTACNTASLFSVACSFISA